MTSSQKNEEKGEKETNPWRANDPSKTDLKTCEIEIDVNMLSGSCNTKLDR